MKNSCFMAICAGSDSARNGDFYEKKMVMASMVLTMSVYGTSAGNTPTDESGTPVDTGKADRQQDTSSKTSGSEAPETGAVTTSGDYVIDLSDLEHQTDTEDVPIVYFTNVINSGSLMAIYEALGRTPTGNVAVKLHTGEGENSYNLEPDFIKDLVQAVDGTIVECNTAYGGNRASTALHMQVAEDRGYTAIADVDIMDADGGLEISVIGGTRLETNQVGSHFTNYDFYTSPSNVALVLFSKKYP